jgi:hypothetical protein
MPSPPAQSLPSPTWLRALEQISLMVDGLSFKAAHLLVSQKACRWNGQTSPPCDISSQQRRQLACEPHRAWIEQQVRLKRNGRAIYQDLVDQFCLLRATRA